jgi:RNA polymerase sigma-B factor
VDEVRTSAGDRARHLSHDEVRERFRALQGSGDPQLRDALILEHRWIAEHCSRRFRYRGETDADLLQVAWLGLVKAVDRYDPDRDVPFHGYAIPTILGELKRYFRDSTWAIGVSRNSKDLMPRLRAAADGLHQRFGRSPTVDELADELVVDREVVIAAIAARDANRTVPMSTLVAEPVGGSTSPMPDGQQTLDAVETRLAALGALGQLDERSRTILVWRFYEELTQREIGERLGIGQVQVSRLLRSALDRMRLRASLENEGLA